MVSAPRVLAALLLAVWGGRWRRKADIRVRVRGSRSFVVSLRDRARVRRGSAPDCPGVAVHRVFANDAANEMHRLPSLPVRGL